MKNAIEKAMKNNLVYSKEEAKIAIEFIQKLLELQIAETRELEPYAISSTKDAEVAVRKVADLLDYLEE